MYTSFPTKNVLKNLTTPSNKNICIFHFGTFSEITLWGKGASYWGVSNFSERSRWQVIDVSSQYPWRT
jgi:hypothetical protein